MKKKIQKACLYYNALQIHLLIYERETNERLMNDEINELKDLKLENVDARFLLSPMQKTLVNV